MIGQQLGSYRVTRRLSAGGMGEVYVAEHVLIGRQAAIKLLLPQISQNKDIVNRFFNEARATSAIGHPGIVQIFDFGLHSDGRAYCVMEFLEGEPLQDRIKKNGKLALGHAIDVLQHVCSALGAAHRKGIVHRDLKPDNIFLVPDPGMRFGERAKLLDFGIAKLQDQQSEDMKTRTGMVMGTPSYMAPEQCRGAGEVDHRADVYALGCIFFAMLCGRPPFVGAGAGEIIGMQQFMEPPRPSSIEPSIDPHTEGLILHLLQKRPEARVQSTDELARALEALEAHMTGGMPKLRAPTGDRGPQPVVEAAAMPAPRQSTPSVPVSPMVTVPLARPAVAITTPQPAALTSMPPHTLDGKQPATTLHRAAVERPGSAAPGTRTSRRWLAITAGMGVTAAVGITVLSLMGSDKTSSGIAATTTADASVDASAAIATASVDAAPHAPEPAGAGTTGTTQAAGTGGTAQAAGATETPQAEPKTVKLVIESTPTGAAVRLDGSQKLLGYTPYGHEVPQGDETLTFNLFQPGYLRGSVTFSTAENDTKTLTLKRDETSKPRRSSARPSLLDVDSKPVKPETKDPKKPPDTKDPFGNY